MAEKRSVDDFLLKDAVQAVPSKAERLVVLLFQNDRSFAAIFILVIGLLLASSLALFSSALQTQGFQLLNTLASGAAGYFFATRGKPD